MDEHEIYKQIYPRAATVSAAACAILFCIVGVIGTLFVSVFITVMCAREDMCLCILEVHGAREL